MGYNLHHIYILINGLNCNVVVSYWEKDKERNRGIECVKIRVTYLIFNVHPIGFIHSEAYICIQRKMLKVRLQIGKEIDRNKIYIYKQEEKLMHMIYDVMKYVVKK